MTHRRTKEHFSCWMDVFAPDPVEAALLFQISLGDVKEHMKTKRLISLDVYNVAALQATKLEILFKEFFELISFFSLNSSKKRLPIFILQKPNKKEFEIITTKMLNTIL